MACDQLLMEGDGTELKEVTPISCSNLWQRDGIGMFTWLCVESTRVAGQDDKLDWSVNTDHESAEYTVFTLYFLSRLASFSV